MPCANTQAPTLSLPASCAAFSLGPLLQEDLKAIDMGRVQLPNYPVPGEALSVAQLQKKVGPARARRLARAHSLPVPVARALPGRLVGQQGGSTAAGLPLVHSFKHVREGWARGQLSSCISRPCRALPAPAAPPPCPGPPNHPPTHTTTTTTNANTLTPALPPAPPPCRR